MFGREHGSIAASNRNCSGQNEGETLPCLVQTGESFLLRFKIVHFSGRHLQYMCAGCGCYIKLAAHKRDTQWCHGQHDPKLSQQEHREGGNYPAAPASIPAQGCHAGSGGWKLSRCACQYPSTSVPCSIERVEIIPLRLPVSQHKGAMQDREGGNYPAAPASIPIQVCHAASGRWKLSRCACEYPSTPEHYPTAPV
jgi:hypothetical protein